MSLISRFILTIAVSISGSAFANDPVITVPYSNYILIDAKSASCKQMLSQNPAHDINALYTDIGKLKLSWAPKSQDSQLHIVYIKFYMESKGLANQTPKTFAGEDLNCIFNGDLQKEVTLSASQREITAIHNLILGDLSPKDPTKREGFKGNAKVLVYGIEKAPGEMDTPVEALSTFNFQYDGAF